LTHQRLTVRFWWIIVPEDEVLKLPEDMAFYSRSEVEELPKPILMDTVLKEELYL